MPIPEKIANTLLQAQRVLLVSHVSPDGDTLGAGLALRLAFLALGKEAVLICQDAVPELYEDLPGAQTVKQPEALEGAFDTALAVDVSDRLRLGSCQAAYEACPVRLVLDHHGTNDCFGQLNWVEANASATGVLAQELIERLGVPLTREMALCLYTAISTDTGHFQFANTTGAAMRAAADMVDMGVDVAAVTAHLYREMPRAKTALLARALHRLTFAHDGRTAYITLRRADFDACGAKDEMTEGVINYAIQTRGVEVAFLATERAGGVKFSLRAKAPFDVAKLCRQFGGGGHALAAGCTMMCALEEAAQVMLDAIAQSREK